MCRGESKEGKSWGKKPLPFYQPDHQPFTKSQLQVTLSHLFLQSSLPPSSPNPKHTNSHHLRPGGRVTGYLSRDLELGRSDCSYTRRPTEVLVPPNCTYATPGRQTYFVPLVTRKVGGGEGGGGVGLGFITGRGRGDVEISRQDQGEGGEEGQEGMALDTKAARKRRRMLAYVLEERGGRRRMMTIAE